MQGVSMTSEELRKLLSAGNSDAALLYLYRKARLPLETAMDTLHFTAPQMVAATDCLRQLGLWETQTQVRIAPEPPVYTEDELQRRVRDPQFSKLIGEAQRRLGRTLSTEDLRILLSLTDYLQMPTEVVGILLSYCIERSRRRDVRMPGMRAIEKEAYRWADEGIDTLEAACYYVQNQMQRQNRIAQLRLLLQIDQRRLTPAEERYLESWIEMGFGDDAIQLAYERTCLNTGALKWAYMNSILKRWHEKGLHTPAQIAQGDVAPAAARRGGYQQHGDALSELERQAVARALAEGQEG